MSGTLRSGSITCGIRIAGRYLYTAYMFFASFTNKATGILVRSDESEIRRLLQFICHVN